MNLLVKRTVRLITPKNDRRFGEEDLSLSDFESDRGYVLLGEPGMGKSTEFREEAKRIGTIKPIPARHFIRRRPENCPEWQKGPLFIDGLDEVRAGGGNPKEVVDQIIKQLEDLTLPQFRLSCRSGSWLGIGDQEELNILSNSDAIPVLQLNPLTHQNIQEILSQRGLEGEKFIHHAHKHNLKAFLFNPQLLNVLLQSWRTNNWPYTPCEAFENACRELIREHNQQHLDARSFDLQPSLEEILNAAGELSALMLIAGKSGWTATFTDDTEILSLSDVKNPNRLAAFDSAIFTDRRENRTPIHRLIAEYLGARYLDGKIRDGLSVRRILTLLVGYDGIPLPDLRGLAGWLAAFNCRARETLIHTDPIAVAFNGDASSFNSKERRQLLENLEHSIDLQYTWPSKAALGALAGRQGMSVIWKLANSPIRSKNRQILVYMLLLGISQVNATTHVETKHSSKTHLDEDCENLLKIIHDRSWKSKVRCEALRAIDTLQTNSRDRGIRLRGLIKDLDANRLSDHSNELRGTILTLLYPGELWPGELWDHLATDNATYRYGAYLRFWDTLVERSQRKQVEELLDSLCDRASEVMPKLANQRLADNVLPLLARGLDLFGDNLRIQKLYRWFELVEFDVFSHQLIPTVSSNQSSIMHNHPANAAIRDWLRQHKETQHALIEKGLLIHKSKIGSELLSKTVGLKFVGKDASPGFRSWCLARAIELCGSQNKVAQELAGWSTRTEEAWGEPLPDDEVTQKVSRVPGLREWNEQRLQNKIQANLKEAEKKKKLADSSPFHFQNQRQRDLEYIEEHKAELAEGRCIPKMLHELASLYFYGFIEKDGHPEARLLSYLNGDQSLVQAALAGFRSLLDRDDLPDLEQIAGFYERGTYSYFALPFLAGMYESDADDILSRQSEKEKRRALGFYLVTDLPHQQHVPFTNPPRKSNLPTWYEKALDSYPEAMADSLVAIHNAGVRSKTLPNELLFKIAFDEAYASVAKLSVKRMFTVFPTRCSKRQLEFLRIVLWSALLARGMSTEALREITLRRLKRKRMDPGQRAQWLCAGLFVAKGTCLPLLAEFLAHGGETRIRHIIDFLLPTGYKRSGLLNVNDWNSEEIASLIRILGKQIQPPITMERAGFLSTKQIIGRHFESLAPSWIGVLSKRADDDSVRAMNMLASDPNLSAWEPILLRAQEDQIRLRRLAKRPDLSIEKIQQALQNGSPVSSADLTSLTVDALEELANCIRDEATSDWRQYWHWDQKTGQPKAPQHEDECRNRLLSDLSKILGRDYQIDAHAEGRYADDRRADIRVSYGANLAIPIEIKKNSHRELWRGITEQLVPKYTRDPKADGYGIYLVFWFGSDRKYMRIVSPHGGIPKKPEELRALLRKGLDPIQKNRIYIVVIDVSPRGRYAEE